MLVCGLAGMDVTWLSRDCCVYVASKSVTLDQRLKNSLPRRVKLLPSNVKRNNDFKERTYSGKLCHKRCICVLLARFVSVVYCCECTTWHICRVSAANAKHWWTTTNNCFVVDVAWRQVHTRQQSVCVHVCRMQEKDREWRASVEASIESKDARSREIQRQREASKKQVRNCRLLVL